MIKLNKNIKRLGGVAQVTISEVRAKLEPNYDKHYEKVRMYCYSSKERAIKYIQEQTDCDYWLADKIVHEWINRNKNIQYKNPNDIEVKCKYCNSTNTTKISELSKVGRFALFGIFSLSKNSKQWHCNNCKSDFQQNLCSNYHSLPQYDIIYSSVAVQVDKVCNKSA